MSKEKNQQIAEESLKTRKAREKLRRHLEKLDAHITPQALKEKSIEIHRWITRHAEHRVVLKEKSISLFDENQNAAKLSQRIAKIAQQLQAHE
jgi:FtsZ-binding cell division protein ZapB